MNSTVYLYKVVNYDSLLNSAFLESNIFDSIQPNDTVILKPNWVKECHIQQRDVWECVITHPQIITIVLKMVISKLERGGKIIITDGPQTDSSFQKILAHYPVNEWLKITSEKGILLEIIDLREDEWLEEDNVIIKRTKLLGDPKGSTEVNLLDDASELYHHKKSKRGYYGADYNFKETNDAHDGHNNLYRVSRSVIEGDVFINLPKLKTHKKAGITCCLKNLVGINTYKNYLPHHSEGSPSEGGDQYPVSNLNALVEGPIMAFLKQNILGNTTFAKILKPFGKVARKFFGDTNTTIRSGNWYGNDTVWRMTLDLNKILFYANSNGSLREDKWLNSKKYIGIVDAIIAGEGNGPMAPDPVTMEYLITGTNPVAIDTVCSYLMGFDPMKITTIRQAYQIKRFPLCDFKYEDVEVIFENKKWKLAEIPKSLVKSFKPHFGWVGQIEDHF